MEQVTGESIPAGIGRTMVDRTIASGFRLLKFPRRLEAAFELEVGRERCRQLALGGLFGVLLFDLFVISDWLITPDIFVTALWVRLGIVTPIALLMIASLYLYPPVAVREWLVAVGAVFLGAGGNLYLMLASRSPYHEVQHQTIILILLFVAMVQRVRFWYSVPACLACFALHAWGLAQLLGYPFEF